MNMKFVYRKKLTPVEAERHYIYVDKGHRDIFPTPREEFKIVITHNRRVLKAKIDANGRIFSPLYEYITFKEGDTIIFAKNPNGSFNVSIRE